MTPDRYHSTAGPQAPQSWNRYAYVQGDPTNANDPRGMDLVWIGDDGGDFVDIGGGGGPGGGGGSIGGCLVNSFDPVPDPFCDGPIFLSPMTPVKSASPPPCQDDWGNVYLTLESLGTNIMTLAEQNISGLNSQEISALNATIQSDVTGEMNTIMAAGTGNTSPPYYQGGHYNLDITNQSITTDLGTIFGNQFIKEFTVGFFGTLDGVRQSAPNQPGYTLHSHKDGSQVDFHFDQYGYGNLPGHWGWDVGYGSLAHPCLDPAWQH